MQKNCPAPRSDCHLLQVVLLVNQMTVLLGGNEIRPEEQNLQVRRLDWNHFWQTYKMADVDRLPAAEAEVFVVVLLVLS